MKQVSEASRLQQRALARAMPRSGHLDNLMKQVSEASRLQQRALARTMPRSGHLDNLANQLECISGALDVAANATVVSRLLPQIEAFSDLRNYSANSDPSMESCTGVNSHWIDHNSTEELVDPLEDPSDEQIQWADLVACVMARFLICLLLMMMCADIGLQTGIAPLDDSFVASETILSGIFYTIYNNESLPVYLFWLPLTLFFIRNHKER